METVELTKEEIFLKWRGKHPKEIKEKAKKIGRKAIRTTAMVLDDHGIDSYEALKSQYDLIGFKACSLPAKVREYVKGLYEYLYLKPIKG